METQETPKEQALTKEDVKVLESMFHQSCQELYVIVNLIELGLFGIYKQTKDSRELVKRQGKQRADAIVAHTVHDQLFNHDEQYHTGTILRKISELKQWLDRLFEVGVAVHPKVPDAAKKEYQLAEELMHDGRLMAWRHAMQCNIPEGEDIKVDSTLKLLAKDHTVSARIIDRLKPEK